MVRIINIDTKTRTIRVSNGKDDLDWFTTDTGSHVPLKKGQSKAEAIKEHFGDGRSSGKKRLDELNKKYGTNKGYLIQSDKPLDKKKDGVIKEYEDFGKATPEVSLTETGSGFHERTKQPAKQAKGTDENGTVWINIRGTIIPLRVRDNSGIDPKILATPEEIKRGRAKYEGIKDRQDAAREKAKSGRTYADVIDEENWEELSRKYLRDYGGGKKLNRVELNSLMDGDKLDIIEKRKVREAMKKIGGLEE